MAHSLGQNQECKGRNYVLFPVSLLGYSSEEKLEEKYAYQILDINLKSDLWDHLIILEDAFMQIDFRVDKDARH